MLLALPAELVVVVDRRFRTRLQSLWPCGIRSLGLDLGSVSCMPKKHIISAGKITYLSQLQIFRFIFMSWCRYIQWDVEAQLERSSLQRWKSLRRIAATRLVVFTCMLLHDYAIISERPSRAAKASSRGRAVGRCKLLFPCRFQQTVLWTSRTGPSWVTGEKRVEAKLTDSEASLRPASTSYPFQCVRQLAQAQSEQHS
jgi:hypothetical protein